MTASRRSNAGWRAGLSEVDGGRLLRIQAHANRLANFRLHRAMAVLPQAELHVPRTGFFGSLMATLNHILSVDAYYVGALLGQPDVDRCWHRFEPAMALAELAERQARSDERLVAYCDNQSDFERSVRLPRGAGRVQIDAAAFVLQHLFSHQVHHRSTSTATPQNSGVQETDLAPADVQAQPAIRIVQRQRRSDARTGRRP